MSRSGDQLLQARSTLFTEKTADFFLSSRTLMCTLYTVKSSKPNKYHGSLPFRWYNNAYLYAQSPHVFSWIRRILETGHTWCGPCIGLEGRDSGVGTHRWGTYCLLDASSKGRVVQGNYSSLSENVRGRYIQGCVVLDWIQFLPSSSDKQTLTSLHYGYTLSATGIGTGNPFAVIRRTTA